MNKKSIIALGIGLCAVTACASSIISVTVATNQFYKNQLNAQNQGIIQTQDLPTSVSDASIQNSQNILTSGLPTTETTQTPTTNTVTTAQTTVTTTSSYIGEEKAKEIALAHAGLNESDVTFIRCNLDYDNGITEYEVEFYSENMEYDYDINATTGDILSYDFEMDYGSISQGTSYPNYTVSLDEAQAISIALAHANLSESGVTGLRCKLDYDDGIAEYEVEWYVGRTEYEYTIHAETGTILEFDVDRD